MQSIYTILLNSIEGWNNLSENDIKIEPIIGGLSNKLYIAEINKAQIAIQKVLIRIYGGPQRDSEESSIDRKEETKIFRILAKKKIAPKLYHSFDDGRLEEFIDGRIVDLDEMQNPLFYTQIASETARFHQVNIGGNRSPEIFNRIKQYLSIISNRQLKTISSKGKSLSDPNFSNTIKEDFYSAKENKTLEVDREYFRRRKSAQISLDTYPDLNTLYREFEWLKMKMESFDPVVEFCHNDIQRGNILLTPSKTIHLIDFEYATWNYRSFEFGNYFCECYIDNFATDDPLGFTVHTNRFPTKEMQSSFIRAFLTAFEPNKVVSDETVKKMVQETQIGILCSHFHWALWSLIQAVDSNISWNYHDYAIARFAEYNRLKLFVF